MKTLIATSLVLLFLAACGGGSSGSEPNVLNNQPDSGATDGSTNDGSASSCESEPAATGYIEDGNFPVYDTISAIEETSNASLDNFSSSVLSNNENSEAGTGDEIAALTGIATAQIDLNNDGYKDLVVAYRGKPSPDITTQRHEKTPMRMFLQVPNGFSDSNCQPHTVLIDAGNLLMGYKDDGSKEDMPASEYTRMMVVEDFNGDGHDDIFVGNHGLEAQYPELGISMEYWGEEDFFIMSDSNGLYHVTRPINWVTEKNIVTHNEPFAHYTHGASANDFDKDGDTDLLINVTTASRAIILVNDGLGNFSEYDDSKMPHRTDGRRAGGLWSAFLDANKDNCIDIAIFDERVDAYGQNGIYLNDCSGNFNTAVIQFPTPIASGRQEDAEVTDIDGDGNLDIILQAIHVPTEHRMKQLLMGQGDGSFVDETTTRLPEQVIPTTRVDSWYTLNDVVNGGTSATTIINENIFYELADVDADGDMDIVEAYGNGWGSWPAVWINDNGVFRVYFNYQTVVSTSAIWMDMGEDGDMDVVDIGPSIEIIEATGRFQSH